MNASVRQAVINAFHRMDNISPFRLTTNPFTMTCVEMSYGIEIYVNNIHHIPDQVVCTISNNGTATCDIVFFKLNADKLHKFGLALIPVRDGYFLMQRFDADTYPRKPGGLHVRVSESYGKVDIDKLTFGKNGVTGTLECNKGDYKVFATDSNIFYLDVK